MFQSRKNKSTKPALDSIASEIKAIESKKHESKPIHYTTQICELPSGLVAFKSTFAEVWDLDKDECVYRSPDFKDSYGGKVIQDIYIAVHADGRLIMAGKLGLFAVDPLIGELETFDVPHVLRNEYRFIACNLQGKLVAMDHGWYYIHLGEEHSTKSIESSRLYEGLYCSSNYQHQATMLSDGRLAVCSSYENTKYNSKVRIIDVNNPGDKSKEIEFQSGSQLKGAKKNINALFGFSNGMLATCHKNVIYLYDTNVLRTSKIPTCIAEFKTDGIVDWVALVPTGRYLVSNSRDDIKLSDKIIVWDVTSNKAILTIPTGDREVTALTVLSNFHLLYVLQNQLYNIDLSPLFKKNYLDCILNHLSQDPTTLVLGYLGCAVSEKLFKESSIIEAPIQTTVTKSSSTLFSRHVTRLDLDSTKPSVKEDLSSLTLS